MPYHTTRIVMRTQLPFLAFFAASLAPASAEPEFLDEFAKAPSAPTWSWVREDPEGWRIKDGALEVRAQTGRVWAGKGAKNILVLEHPAGGASAAVDVDLGAPKTKYEQGGLLVYRDDDNFVKLIVEHIDGGFFIVMAREIGRRGKVFTKIDIGSKAARIRSAVAGDKVTVSYKLPGEDKWRAAGECELPGAAEAKFAIFNQDGSDTETRWIRFDNFKYKRAP